MSVCELNPSEKVFLDLLRCPRTGERLHVEEPIYQDGRIESGWLVAAESGHRYPIQNFVPRFVGASNYADNFGMQWNKFRKTQLDSFSQTSISHDRFWRATGWDPSTLAGKLVLDAGCGAGRFAEIALKADGIVVALDYSSAVDACYSNLRGFKNLFVVQGDIYAPPFQKECFAFIYSLGVLQHTPDVEKAFRQLPNYAKSGAFVCADFYWRRLRTMLHPKYLLRPVSKRIQKERLFRALEVVIPGLLRCSQSVSRVPIIGRLLKRAIPVADYSGIYPLNTTQLQEWALLDTFDMLAPEYDNPQTAATVRLWFESAGLQSVEVLHEGHLVGRGRKP